MRVRVYSDLDDLARDLAAGAAKVKTGGRKVVRKNTRAGRTLARKFARAKAGPHGTNYYKRITDEMTGPLQGEYGPAGDVVGNAVGGGWRNGAGNTDLPRSADVIGPKFAKDAGDLLDGLL